MCSGGLGLILGHPCCILFVCALVFALGSILFARGSVVVTVVVFRLWARFWF